MNNDKLKRSDILKSDKGKNSDGKNVAFDERKISLNENDPFVREIRNIERQIDGEKRINKAKTFHTIKLNYKVQVVLFCVGAGLFAGFVVMIGEMPIIALVLLLFSLFFLIPMITYWVKPMQKSKNKKTKLQILENRMSKLLTIDTKAVKFYDECAKIIADGKRITETISIVGQKYGFYDIKQANDFYKKGENEKRKKTIILAYKQEKIQKDNQLELYEKEQQKANEISEQRLKKGKEKYLTKLKKWLELIETQKRVAINMRTISKCNEKKDLSITQSDIADDLEKRAKSEEAKVSRYLQLMDAVLIDEQNIEAKFKLLDISDICISLTEGQNLLVTMKLKCLSKPVILSKPAILDGTLKISILDTKNKNIATGFYVAAGYEEYNYQNAGFKDEESIEIVCPIDLSVNTNDLKCKITPEALWFIEESEDIFMVDNSTITEGYEKYEKIYNKQAKNVILNM